MITVIGSRCAAVVLLQLLLLSLAMPALGQEAEEPGQVRLPLDTYNQLVDQTRTPAHVPRPVPAAFALGSAQVSVNVTAGEPPVAEVAVEMKVDVLEDEWSSVPVLPAGTAVSSASVNGQPVQLISSPYGLVWGVKQAGSYSMSLRYRVDANGSDRGYALPVPLPQAAATNLVATLPGTGLDVAVIPAAGVTTQPAGRGTQVRATIPTSGGVQISWRTPVTEGHALSRARYAGDLVGQAVAWTGELDVEVFNDDTVTLALLPRSVTLRELRVDGKEAPILTEGARFATLVKGRGRHQVQVGFEVPVVRTDGPPRINLVVPQVPVSRFDLTLPGKKEVSVTPNANVTSRSSGNTTVATAWVPMCEQVSFTWAEAVPEAIRAEVRANAAIYHTVHAEEGVLYVHAMVHFEVTRGETSLIKLEVPQGVQVNRVESPSGAVADWRIEQARPGAVRVVSIFLDRKVSGELLLDVYYDRSLGEAATLEVPLLRAAEAQRQRGMVALLSSQELTLKPVDEGGATRVGENQLPAFVRNAVQMTVAHTFKYVDLPQHMQVEAQPPERKQGRFDAQVDTLVSVAETTLQGQASVEVNVKSGGIMDLVLTLPKGVNVLSLTGPSLRTYDVEDEDDLQRIDVHFTQEMEGQFRLEVTYEGRIPVEEEAEVEVPTLAVQGAEGEQGRLAVQALTAVEVQAAVKDELTELDISELPQQLVLRTTNPILLAFKYLHVEPEYRLVLRVTRHRLVEVKEAAIDQARYQTLFTPDGLAVTTAEFTVRNSRQQFLRPMLPRDSEVWSVFVDGKAEKPALGTDEASGGDTVLIKIVTSNQGFPVQLIYATSGMGIGRLGRVSAGLPRPDILVTHSRWDVYLPDGVSYGTPSTNMEVVVSGVRAQPPALDAQMGEARMAAGAQQVGPLQITIPTAGIHYAFEKLYANQGRGEARFAISYASGWGAGLGRTATILGTALLWFAGLLLVRPDPRVSRGTAVAAGVAGLVILVVMTGVYRFGLQLVVVESGLIAALLAGLYLWRRARSRHQEPPPITGAE